jgi:hypothetical protein
MPIIIDTNRHGIRRERNTDKEKEKNKKRRTNESRRTNSSYRRKHKDHSGSIKTETNS